MSASKIQECIQSERGKDCMNYLKELLFPGRCAVCDEIVKIGQNKVCGKCKDKFVPIQEPWCMKCGKQLTDSRSEYCGDCIKREHKFTRGRAVFSYDSVASSLYRFKYQGRQEYAEYYGECAARILDSKKIFKYADALIPVPLHFTRQRKRGYNQAELLAIELGKRWNIPVRRDLVIRQKKTIPLKQLNPVQRQNNLKKAFKLTQNDVKLKTIIIVDDIYTTGSTIDSVAELFWQNGVRNIFFITLAVGEGY